MPSSVHVLILISFKLFKHYQGQALASSTLQVSVTTMSVLSNTLMKAKLFLGHKYFLDMKGAQFWYRNLCCVWFAMICFVAPSIHRDIPTRISGYSHQKIEKLQPENLVSQTKNITITLFKIWRWSPSSLWCDLTDSPWFALWPHLDLIITVISITSQLHHRDSHRPKALFSNNYHHHMGENLQRVKWHAIVHWSTHIWLIWSKSGALGQGWALGWGKGERRALTTHNLTQKT